MQIQKTSSGIFIANVHTAIISFQIFLFYNFTNFFHICPRIILSHYFSILYIRKQAPAPLHPLSLSEGLPQLSPSPSPAHEKSPAGTKPTGLSMLKTKICLFALICGGDDSHLTFLVGILLTTVLSYAEQNIT